MPKIREDGSNGNSAKDTKARLRWNLRRLRFLVPILFAILGVAIGVRILQGRSDSLERELVRTFQYQQFALARSIAANAQQTIRDAISKLGLLAKNANVIQKTAETREALDAFMESYSDFFTSVSTTDATGQVVFHSPGKGKKQDLGNRSGFVGVREGAKSFIEAAERRGADGREEETGGSGAGVVRLFVPIRTEGEFSGAVCGEVNLTRLLSRCISSLEVSLSDIHYVVDADGGIFYHTNPRYLHRTWGEIEREIHESVGPRADGVEIAQKAIRQRVQRGESGTAQFVDDSTGGRKLIAFTPIIASNVRYGLGLETSRWRIAVPVAGYSEEACGVLLVAAGLLFVSGFAAWRCYKWKVALDEQIKNDLYLLRMKKVMSETKQDAEAAVSQKTQFINKLTYAVRAHMNGIIGMAEMAMDTQHGSDRQEYLNTLKDSADSLVKALNDVLDFSDIEVAKLELAPIEFNLRSCMSDVLTTLSRRAQPKKLSLHCSIQPDVPNALFGDAGRLRQIIINLVGNAIKFTEHGQVAVEVKLESQPADGVRLHFTVTDTGIGIPAEKQALVRKTLEHPDALTAGQYGQTGLGLMISTRLIKMMSGRVWFESPPTRGTALHFTARFGLRTPRAAVETTAKPVSLDKMAVLAATMDGSHQATLERLLVQWRMKPTLVQSGQAALEALNQAAQAGEPFPLVLLVGDLAEMDGFALAEQIRQNQAMNEVVLIMLTSAGRRGDAARCRRLNIAAYLTRPISPSLFLEAVQASMSAALSAPDRPPLLTRHSLREAHRRLRILVAEDNPANQRAIAVMVANWDHTVTAVCDGAEALSAIEREPFDLILMDADMPNVDGLAATASIREKERDGGGRIPIVGMISREDPPAGQECLDCGMDASLTKPVQPAALFEAVEQARLAKVATPPATGVSPEGPDVPQREKDLFAHQEALADCVA